LKSALDRTERPPLQISFDTTSIKEKVTAIGGYLEERGLVEFSSFIPPGTKRFEIVVSFLAILELARLKCIEIIQTETFGPIQLRQVKSVKDLNMNLLQQF
jgi:segregation and condensation protein A